jgi:hypothetical protein
MKKVAVLAFKQKEVSVGYDDYETLNLPVYCTEWTELSDNEFKDLNMAIEYINRNNQYKNDYLKHVVILQPKIENDTEQKSYILEKISDYKEYIKKEEEKIKKEKEKVENKKREKKLIKEAKTLEEKKRLFESLKAELEGKK